MDLRATATVTVRRVVAAALALALARELLRRFTSPFKEPGFRLPFVGHLHAMDYRNLAWELERLRRRVGERMMGVFLGPDYMVYVTSPELTYHVFALHADKSSGRSVFIPPELPSSTRGVVLNSGKSWIRHRQLLLRELVGSKHRTTVASEVFDELAFAVRDAAAAAAATGSDQRVPQFGYLVHRAVASGMCVLIFGSRLDDSVVNEIIEHTDYLGMKAFDYMMLTRVPLYRWFGFEVVAKFENSCRRMLAIVDGILQQRAAGTTSSSSSETDASRPSVGMPTLGADLDKADLPDLNEVLFEAIQGGLDTTTAMIEWAVAYLTAHPQIQARVHAELDDVCQGNKPSMEDRPKLELLNAVILETLRMAQVSSVVVPHQATEDIDVGAGLGVIPKGATLLFSFNELHASPKLWRAPHEFIPDRFLQEDRGLTANPNEDLTSKGEFKKFMPFGIGSRHCPGYTLATLELYLSLARLLQAFEFSSAEPVDLAHYTDSIPVRVRGFKPVVKVRAGACKWIGGGGAGGVGGVGFGVGSS